MSHSHKIAILITGVAGFIGSNLADRFLYEIRNQKPETRNLGSDLRIIGIDNLSYGVKEQIPESVEFYQEDVRRKSIYPLFKDVDYVFHFAARTA